MFGNTGFPLAPPPATIRAVSIDPDVSPSSKLRLQRNYLERISSFDGHPIFPHLNLPATIPKKSISNFNGLPHFPRTP